MGRPRHASRRSPKRRSASTRSAIESLERRLLLSAAHALLEYRPWEADTAAVADVIDSRGFTGPLVSAAAPPAADVSPLDTPADSTGPRVLSHSVNVTGSTVTVDLTFSEPIDPATLNADSVFFDELGGELSLAGQFGGLFYGVEVIGTLAYVADGAGIRILDVSTPAMPVQIGRYVLPDSAYDISVVVGIAYVAGGGSGLQVLNVSNPAAITHLGGYDTAGYAYAVQVVGGIAYVADGSGGLQVLDVSNPTAIACLGGYRTDRANDVQVVGSIAYVGDSERGLQILDVSDPATITRLGGTDDLGYWYDVQAVQIVGSLAYVVDFGDLIVFDVTDPAAIRRLGKRYTGLSKDVQVVGSIAYVADKTAGLRVLNVSNPAAITLLGYYITAGLGYGVHVVGGIAYVADYDEGLQVLNVSNAARITRLGGYSTGAYWAYGAQVVDSIAYVANNDGGLQVLDVSNPAAITRLGGYDTNGWAKDVQVVGSVAYLADSDSGLQVLDVSNPAAITRLGGYDTKGSALDVQVVGGIAYVADADRGLQVLDVSNPAAIIRLGGYDTTGLAHGVQVVGSIAYVAHGLSGLQVLDVSNPAAITRLGGYDTTGYAYDVQVVGSIAYVADGFGLQVLDVSDHAATSWLGGYDTTGPAFDVQVVGDIAYVADDSSGLQVLDVSNPAAIARLAAYDTPGSGRGVQVVGGTAYLADYSVGLWALSLPGVAFAGTVTPMGGNTYRLTQVLPEGTYSLRIGPDVLDLSGNAMDQDQNGMIGEATDDFYLIPNIVVGPTAGPDALTVTREGDNAVVYVDGAVYSTVPLSSTSVLALKTLAGDDTITLDFSNGSPIPAGGLAIDGGDHTSTDKLIIRGTPSTDTVSINPSSATVNAATFTFTNIEQVTFDPNGGATALTANADVTLAASQTFSSLTIANGATVTLLPGMDKTLTIGTLAIAPTAQLDLTDNDLVVTGMSAADVRALLLTGFNVGDWAGPGLTSSAARNDPTYLTALGYADNADLGYTTFAGQPVSSTDILVKYTYYGDSDVNGIVDADDLTNWIDGFNSVGSPLWLYGDFDYSGVVDADDLTLWVDGFLNPAGPLSSPLQRQPAAASTTPTAPKSPTLFSNTPITTDEEEPLVKLLD